MWEIEYYKTENCEEVIYDFIESLPEEHEAKVFWEIELLSKFGTNLKMPYVKHIEDELWELRIKCFKNISRIFYFIPMKDRIVLLHGFVKKQNKTPKREIERAKQRILDYKRRFLK